MDFEHDVSGVFVEAVAAFEAGCDLSLLVSAGDAVGAWVDRDERGAPRFRGKGHVGVGAGEELQVVLLPELFQAGQQDGSVPGPGIRPEQRMRASLADLHPIPGIFR